MDAIGSMTAYRRAVVCNLQLVGSYLPTSRWHEVQKLTCSHGSATETWPWSGQNEHRWGRTDCGGIIWLQPVVKARRENCAAKLCSKAA